MEGSALELSYGPRWLSYHVEQPRAPNNTGWTLTTRATRNTASRRRRVGKAPTLRTGVAPLGQP